MILTNIVALFTIHNEIKCLDLVRKAAESLIALQIPIICIYDLTTPEPERGLVNGYRFKEYWCTPPMLDGNIPLKLKWAYDQIKGFEFVLINQADDFALPNRAQYQMDAMLEHPECGISLCGFEVLQNGKSSHNDTFQQLYCGWNVGYPSCWMLRKSLIPTLPLLPGFEIPYEYDWDPMMLLMLQTQTRVLVLQEILEQYNMHSNNQSATYENKRGNEIRQFRFDRLIDFFMFQKPRLLPVIRLRQLPPKTQTILIIGWMHPARMAGGLANAFEQMGYNVIRVAMDNEPPHALPIKVDWHIQSLGIQRAQLYYRGHKKFPIKLALANFRFDWILLVQNTILEYDISDVIAPLYLLYHEGCWDRMFYSRNTQLTGIFWAFYHGRDQLEEQWYEELNACKTEALSLYASEPSIYQDRHCPRDIIIGLKGARGYGARNRWLKHVYDDRERFIGFLQSKYPHVFNYEPRSDGPDFVEKFVVFMNRCVVALNTCPSTDSYINERQFQAITMGCVLLQQRYYELKDQGFLDYVNCLLFDNEAELDLKVQWILSHPNELQLIRDAGLKLVNERHTMRQRAEGILWAIQNPKTPIVDPLLEKENAILHMKEAEELDRQLWCQWHQSGAEEKNGKYAEWKAQHQHDLS